MFLNYEALLGYHVCAYADAGYRCSQYLQTAFRNVEWGFGQVLFLFPYTDSPGFKRLGGTATGQHYINE